MMANNWRLTGSYTAIDEGPSFDLRRLVGRIALRAASHVGRVAYLMWETVRGLPEWRIWAPRAVEQAVHVGYGSLFIVLLTAGFAGGVTSLQAGYQFTGGIPVYFAAGVIVESIVLELGPVLTGLILAGRIGARYAAELGTMRVTE
ncbi:MAG: ABC transporter permease, partial [Gemmatimonadota bacterium]